MNIPAWLSAWWSSLSPVWIAAFVILAGAIGCIVVEILRAWEADRASVDSDFEALVREQVAEADRAAIRAAAIRSADVAPERRPMWGEISQ